jgi:uncharacterized membrane protein
MLYDLAGNYFLKKHTQIIRQIYYKEETNMLEEERKRNSRRKLSSIINVILGILWIYMGISRTFVDNKWNIVIIIIGIALIVVSLSMLKDHYSAKNDR